MMLPIKLAIVGASSTGKTTLWKLLQEDYKTSSDIAFVHESAREFFLKNSVEERFSLDSQKRILELVLHNEQLAHNLNPKIIITDTSALEVVFYTKVNSDEAGANMLLKKIQPWLKTYSKFLLLNPEDVRFENDEVRQESKEVRDMIHNLMVDFYHKEKLLFEFISGTIPERKKRIQDIIQTYKNI